MAYKSRLKSLVERQRLATNEALKAAAEYGVEVMKQTIPPDYYTGGEYATGNLVANIVRTGIKGNQHGKYVKYGVTPEARYAWFWEYGFWKLPAVKTRRGWITINDPSRAVWRRKEIWVPTYQRIKPELTRIFKQTYQRVLRKSRAS